VPCTASQALVVSEGEGEGEGGLGAGGGATDRPPEVAPQPPRSCKMTKEKK